MTDKKKDTRNEEVRIEDVDKAIRRVLIKHNERVQQILDDVAARSVVHRKHAN
jgi:hypothetical protein